MRHQLNMTQCIMKFGIVFILGFVLANNECQAQYFPLNTNYMFNLLPFNPAYAGTFKRIDVTLDVRNQWAGVEGAPQTQLLTFHKPVRGRNFGYGASVVNDTAGVTSETHITGYYSYAITFEGSRFSQDKHLSFGVSIGTSRFSSDINQLLSQLDDSINPAFNDPLSQGNINLTWAAEAGAGMMFYTSNFFASISTPYLFYRPFDSTVSTEQARQLFLYTGYLHQLNDDFGVRPSVLVRVSDASGILPEFSLIANYRYIVSAGLAYRLKESISAIVQVQANDRISVGYSYDYIVNGLKQTFGSHEVNLNYNLPLEVDRCADFKFF